MNTTIISATNDGDTVIIPGVDGKRIKVLAYTISASASCEVVWKSGSTAISGVMHMATAGNITIHMGDSWPGGGLPVIQTEVGESLVLNLNAGGGHVIGGHLTYVTVAV